MAESVSGVSPGNTTRATSMTSNFALMVKKMIARLQCQRCAVDHSESTGETASTEMNRIRQCDANHIRHTSAMRRSISLQVLLLVPLYLLGALNACKR